MVFSCDEALVPHTVVVDELAESLWRSGQPPFNGTTLVTTLVELPRLRAVIRALSVVLRARFPTVAALQTAEDWHEHDGYITSGAAARWEDLAAALETDDAFAGWTPDDEYVRRAWLAADSTFYLRWFAYDDSVGPSPIDEPAIGGDADLTADAQTIAAAAKAMAALGVEIEVLSAQEFFKVGWGG